MMTTMDDLFGKLMQPGWGGMEPNPAAMQREMEEMKRELLSQAEIVRAFVDAPGGELFLLWLMKKTLMRGPSEAELSATTAEAYAIHKARREGQNGLVLMIINALQVARGEKAKTTGGAA